MLTLKRLELEGFGPFADRNVVTFPTTPGVTVIYGENMRGKTTLLNAIRYAFFGSGLRRGAHNLRLHTISNRELAVAGVFGFEVTLTFDYNGDEYELTRTCKPRVKEPSGDSDYSQTVALRRGNAILGPQERDEALEMAFPSEVSRFFLFDGELLQEYEELLINESDTGQRISAAIERILGVPILKRGRAHLSHLADDASKSAAREALKHQDTQVVGTNLQLAAEQRDSHQSELSRLENDLLELTAERNELESYLLSNQKFAVLLEQRTIATQRLRDIQQELTQYREDLQRAMSESWRTVLRDRVREARLSAHEEASRRIDAMQAHLRRHAIESGRCEVCDQEISPVLGERLLLTLSPEVSDLHSDDISFAMARMAELSHFQETDNSSEVRGIWLAITARTLEEVTIKDQIGDLDTALSGADAPTIRGASASFSSAMEKAVVVNVAIEAHRQKIADLDAGIQRLQKSLDNATEVGLVESRKRERVLREAANVFALAVERYKSELRTEVESTASELFLAMTTEEHDYAGLTINESYGLTIRHRDGRAEEARSAGAEHVVALALMGALQHNAPLRGPIVMDSPFGRLDEGHKSKVVRALPLLADQVILLVYESEIGRDRMRSLLGPALLREYELQKVSARRTVVKEVR